MAANMAGPEVGHKFSALNLAVPTVAEVAVRQINFRPCEKY